MYTTVIWRDLLAGELSNIGLINPNVPSQANVRECRQIAATLECLGIKQRKKTPRGKTAMGSSQKKRKMGTKQPPLVREAPYRGNKWNRGQVTQTKMRDNQAQVMSQEPASWALCRLELDSLDQKSAKAPWTKRVGLPLGFPLKPKEGSNPKNKHEPPVCCKPCPIPESGSTLNFWVRNCVADKTKRLPCMRQETYKQL